MMFGAEMRHFRAQNEMLNVSLILDIKICDKNNKQAKCLKVAVAQQGWRM